MLTIGCVSFLNSKPLIEPLVARGGVEVRFAVPAELLGLVESGQVCGGLLPVVDYQRAECPLMMAPVGAIGCDGPTLTVRIYSQVPTEQIKVLEVDGDSHTSVVLAQVILRERYGVAPKVVPLGSGHAEAILLIGDKVINAEPAPDDYGHQMDLGEEWKKLTGLPFVFACWMLRTDVLTEAKMRGLAELLAWSRRQGAGMTEQLVARYAAEKRWPADLARRYFTEYLRYTVTEGARRGIDRFFDLAGKLGLLEARRKVRYLEVAG